jgi:hypothetical protein
MDWDKVVENLREQTKFYADQANKASMQSGHYDRVKEMRLAADVASILLSALHAGLQHPNGDRQ